MMYAFAFHIFISSVSDDFVQPRNPGVIADNVGDNVGDVAGMGADLFGSMIESIIAAGALGSTGNPGPGLANPLVALPFWIGASGIIASVIGVLCVRTRENAEDPQGALLTAIRIGIAIASVIVAGLTVACVMVLGIGMRTWGCIIMGLVGGIGIGYFTEYATSTAYDPVKQIARAARTGPATVVLEGLSVRHSFSQTLTLFDFVFVMGGC